MEKLDLQILSGRSKVLLVLGPLFLIWPAIMSGLSSAASSNNCGGTEGCGAWMWGLMFSIPIGGTIFLIGLVRALKELKVSLSSERAKSFKFWGIACALAPWLLTYITIALNVSLPWLSLPALLAPVAGVILLTIAFSAGPKK